MTAGLAPAGAPRATAPAAADISVGLGRMAASGDRGTVLSALGLGSCIGLVMVDVRMGVAGLAHVMLPTARGEGAMPGKYADTAAPALLDAVVSLGARRRHVTVKIAGGAQMFAAGSGARALAVGERNIEAVERAVGDLGLRIAAADTGGGQGRTVRVDVTSGRITVRTVGDSMRDL